MRALVQRVHRAAVTVDGREVGRIGRGLLAFVGATHDDTTTQSTRLAEKLHDLRIFPDEDGRMNRSARDVGAAILVVSQFTLYGDTSRGRRPSWVAAARPEQAEPLVEAVVDHLRDRGCEVATGVFRADMDVELVNDGPVTLMLEVDAG